MYDSDEELYVETLEKSLPYEVQNHMHPNFATPMLYDKIQNFKFFL